MVLSRAYRNFTYKEAVFRICCEAFDIVTEEIVCQRYILEDYLQRHPEFATAMTPLPPLSDAPEVALRMTRAADVTGVGPMAAVAGTMAQLAGEAGIRAGAPEVIIENGGDIYLHTTTAVTIGLFAGHSTFANKLAFALEASDTPLAICSSSGKMGHSTSLGHCDLATVVAKDTALADAAATLAANQVSTVKDVDATLDRIAALPGIDGILIIQDDRIGLAGTLPNLVKSR